MPSNMEYSPENNLEIISCSSSLESDRNQSSSFSVLCICPNCGMLKEEESNLEKKRWPMNKLRLLESDSDLSSYSSISSSFSPESSTEMRPMSMDGPNLMENNGDQNSNTESSSISSSFEILVETEINMENSLGAMNHPDFLTSCDCQHPSSSSASHPHSFGYFGNPYRHIKIPNSVMETAKSMCHPQQSAKYLLHHLFTEDVLLRSNVHGSLDEGLCALDCNRINALREFLQDNYPVYDLTENGCDWMLCVLAIDNYIWKFRSNLKNTTIKLQKLLSANPSTQPKPRDDDEPNSSI
ncbi:BEN domain-containing protein 2 [Cavia porcellus]|uniref:BEN domain-containing protein 2 n=1 Tax=Cavia porcellus TaxID=10141 RepID=UPI002FE1F4FF